MKIDHIRVYPNTAGDGFDIVLRVRGGIKKHGSYPTLQAALDCAWALEGRKPGQPIYIYEKSFAESAADFFAPALASLGGAA